MTKIYKAVGENHSVLGVLPTEINLYVSKGYTVYSYDVKPGEVFSEYKVTVGKLWVLEQEPKVGTKHDMLEAPQDILDPVLSRARTALIKDVQKVKKPVMDGAIVLPLMVIGAILIGWFLLMGRR